MSEYRAPIRDMMFVLTELAGLDEVAALPPFGEVTLDLVEQILEENGKFSAEVLSPLNQTGDRQGSKWQADGVRTPDGFGAAYKQFVDGGWNALQFPTAFGGQGLPKVVATPVMEMWKSANLSFSLCPLLTGGAIEALLLRGSDAQKALYLPKMIQGAWTGTMNLTESQAGSDLGLLKSRAIPEADHYRIFGQKIFITFGEHDMAENIVHLVLARVQDAPEGVRGISLFIVPKFLVNADGSLGARNDVRCVSIEHKLGIHASPTAVMQYGEKDGAIGYLIGQENRGLEYMFIMMNAARFAVGMEGVAICERAYQRAVHYARDRIQSKELGGSGSQSVAIIKHPGRASHADVDAGPDRSDARVGVCGCRRGGQGACPSRRARAKTPAGICRSHDPDREGLVDGGRNRSGLDRRAGPRWDGIHRRNRRCAASS